MIFGFTFNGVTPALEQYVHWNRDPNCQGSADVIRRLRSDPVSLNSAKFSLHVDGDPIFRIRRLQAENGILTWVGYYRHAYAPQRTRSGGYMAAGVWFQNSTLLGDDLFEILRELSDILEQNCLTGSEFVRPLAEGIPKSIARLDGVMQEANERIRRFGKTAAEISDTPVVIDLTPADGALQSFFLSYFLVSPSQINQGDLFFFFSSDVRDALQGTRSTHIVNFWRIIDLEIAYLENLDRLSMLNAGTVRTFPGLDQGPIPEAAFSSDNAGGLRKDAGSEFQKNVRTIERLNNEFKAFTVNQKEANRNFSLSISRTTRLVYASVISAIVSLVALLGVAAFFILRII